jgi:hypothetical protein
MSSVVISGDSSGAITLAAPSVAGTNTITLPATTGTMLTTGSPQSGGVIQVVSSNYSTYTTTTSTSYIASGLTATITPKFSTSKILVLITLGSVTSQNSSSAVLFSLYKNGSSLISFENCFGYGSSICADVASNYLDSPATTSATTYAIYWKSWSGNSVQFNNYAVSAGLTNSTITLMEIAG